jgi:hypothetical protein
MNTTLHFPNWSMLQAFLRDARNENPTLSRSLVPALTRPVLVASMEPPQKHALVAYHAEWVKKHSVPA